MANALTDQFAMESADLIFDPAKSILLCRARGNDGRTIWAKKLYDAGSIAGIFEDGECYYINCESGEREGRFLALERESGVTRWFIPGRSFLHVQYEGFLFLVFIDEEGSYYLLKVERASGNALWHHRVDDDLCEYSFTRRSIHLQYSSGKTETLSHETGRAY